MSDDNEQQSKWPLCCCCKNLGRDKRAFYVWEYPVLEVENPEAIGDANEAPTGQLKNREMALCLDHIRSMPVLFNELVERGIINPQLLD